MITAICVTYGRVRFLESALADFLAQENPGPCELLILNTFPGQSLWTNFHGVRVVNLGKRPASLGLARNLAIEQAAGDRIIVWDDDDAYLPHHISTFAANWSDGLDWIWLDTRLASLGDTITGRSIGCHGGCFGFTKRAWAAVGGYPNMTVGEDRVLVQKITKLTGKKVVISHDILPPFIACWGNGSYHVSGEGDDKPGRPGAHLRIDADLSRRLASGREKTGRIQLTARHNPAWLERAQAWLAGELKKNSMNEVCVVELGRYGDIINMLPILQHIHNRFGTPSLMVSREFADLLDGVSYVAPHVVNLRNDQLRDAVKLAKSQYPHVIVSQIWGGPHYYQDHLCDSYNMESWRAAGFLNQFWNREWRPVFDRRDETREDALVSKLKDKRPMVLVNVTHSVSSPFPFGPTLLEEINRQLGKRFNIVNLGGLKLHRIYDMLGLMNCANCLVTVDSAHLHLAAATPIPVVALVNNDPWLGTMPRIAHVAKFRYKDAEPGVNTIVRSIKTLAEESQRRVAGNNGVMEISSAPQRRIFHCCETHAEKTPAEANRKGLARKSWRPLYAAGVVPAYLDEANYPRTADVEIGEPRALPYLKDVLEVGLEVAEDDDIVAFTNDDNYLHPKIAEMLMFHVSIYDCVSSQRCEFKGPMPPFSRPPGDFTHGSMSHMGRDLFAFTARWLRDNWDEIPDFILGCSDWDLCLACMVRKHFGIKSTRQNLEQVIFPAELPLGYVSHVWHAPHWNRAGYVNSAPGQLWNRRLFKKWADKNAPHLKFDSNLCI